MSERSIQDGIGPIRELRPSEDLSMLQTYELRRVFDAQTVASLGLIGAGEIREPEPFRPISAPFAIAAPEATSPEPARAAEASASAPVRARETLREPAAPAVREAEVPRRDWLLQPEPIPQPSEPQPYGDDPVRMRELVQWFADGRAASASVLVPKAAGDLVEGAPAAQDNPYKLRAVLAGRRTG